MKAALVLLACMTMLAIAAGLVTVTIVTPANTPTPTPTQAPDALRDQANLASVQAFSNTLSAQAGQVDRLVDATIGQVKTWQALAVVLAVALVLVATGALVAAGAIVVAVMRRRAEHDQIAALSAALPAAPLPAPVVYVVQAPATADAPALDALERWPEVRARRRAMAELPAPSAATPRREADDR